MSKWKKSPVQIMNEIDNKYQIYRWDTDSNINILVEFVEQNCDPQKFKEFVEKIAKLETRNKSDS